MKCQREGCHRDGPFWPVLFVWAMGVRPENRVEGNAAKLVFRIPICRKCHRKLSPEDLITDEGWTNIREQFAAESMLVPDRRTIRFGYTQIPEGEQELQP